MSVKITIRFSENMALRIQELSKMHGKSQSVIIKALILNSLNAIIDKDGNYITSPNRETVLSLIAKNYARLRDVCNVNSSGIYCSRSKEDIFGDTVLLVSRDEGTSVMTEKELIEHFKYRYNMILYQNVHNEKKRKGVNYADNIQTKERKGETY